MVTESAHHDRVPLKAKTAKKLSPGVREALEIYRGRAEAEEEHPDPDISRLLELNSENMSRNPDAPDGIDPIEPPWLPMKTGWIEWPFEYDQVSWALYQKAFFQISIEAYFFGGKAAWNLARVTQAVARRGSLLRIPRGKFKIYHTGLFMILERNGSAKLTASDLAQIFDSYCPYPNCSMRGTHGAEALRRQREQLRTAKRETVKAAREIAEHGLDTYIQAKFRHRLRHYRRRRAAVDLGPAK